MSGCDFKSEFWTKSTFLDVLRCFRVFAAWCDGATTVILSWRCQTVQDNAVHAKDQVYPPSIGPVMNFFVFEFWTLMMWTHFLHMYYSNNYAWHRVKVPASLPLFGILPGKRNATPVCAHPSTVGWFIEFCILETGNLLEKGLMIRV